MTTTNTMTTTTTTTTPGADIWRDHQRENALAHLEEITAAHQAWQLCHEELEGRDISREAKRCLREHGFDGTNHDDTADAIEEACKESPLAVNVRCSEWRDPGDTEAQADEFQILLSTGGPALRMVGELNQHLEPSSAQLEHQDWFTPWTELQEAEAEEDALLWFARLFWFGEA